MRFRTPSRQQLSAIILFGMVATVHHYFFYPPVVERDRTEAGLHAITNAVSTGDVGRIREEALHYLSDDAEIRLDITYTSLEEDGESSKPAISYDFKKSLFSAYLNNLFRSLSGFTFYAQVQDFRIDKDWDTANVLIVSGGSAVGQSRFMTRARMSRFSFEAACSAHLILTGSRPVADKVKCQLFVPRPAPVS